MSGRARGVFSLRGLRELVLTLGAVAGVLCLLSGAAAIAFDVKPVVFRSGSMSPAIGTGALAFSRTVDASDLRVGDVVTVPSGTGDRITHRIQDISVVDGRAALVLRGDANSAPDDRVYLVDSAPRVLFDVPRAGYVVSFATGPVGIFVGGLLVGVVFLSVVRSARPSAPTGGGGARRALVVVSTVAVAAAVTGVGRTTTNTLAYYEDSATATSGTFTSRAGSPGAPCSYSSSTGLIALRFPTVPGATGYQLRLTLDVVGGAVRTYPVGPDGVVTIPAASLPTGAYVTALTALGLGSGVDVSAAVRTIVVVNVPFLHVLTVTFVCLDVDLGLGRRTAPSDDGSQSGVAPEVRPAPSVPAATDASESEGQQPAPVASPEPTVEPSPGTTPEPTPGPEPTPEESTSDVTASP